GIQPTKADIDSMSGSLSRELNSVMERITEFKAWLDTQTDNNLQTTYGYTASDTANLRSAFNDLAQLVTIYQGTATLATAKDFRTFAKLIWGFGF
ncbi:MAG: hypothetical protein ACXVA4_04085, partial [Ktedonobacterales bacterium]